MAATNLSDGAALAALQEVTEQMRRSMSEGQREAVGSEEEARAALEALLRDHDGWSPTESTGPEAARELLSLMSSDEEAGPIAREVLASPPTDSQMSAWSTPENIALLAGLVTFLQTKIQFHVSRKSGKVSYSFSMTKKGLSDATLGKVLSVVASILNAQR